MNETGFDQHIVETASPQPATTEQLVVSPDRPAAGRGPLWLCLIGIGGLALLLRTQHLADLGMHFDECCSWKISQFPWDEMIDAVSRDAHPPLYYVLMKGLGAIGVESPAGVRGFSVVLGLATVLAAFWFVRTALAEPDDTLVGAAHPTDGRRDACTGTNETSAQGAGVAQSQSTANRISAGERNLVAVFAAALVAASALHVEMSLQARPYTLGTCLALVAGTFLLRGIRSNRSVTDWVGFAISATLLSFTHYYCLFTVAALFLFGAGVLLREMWRRGWNPTSQRLLAGLALSFWGVQLVWSFWLPTFLFQRERSTRQLWMSSLEWKELCNNCWMALASGQSSSVPPEGSWSALAFWAGTTAALFTFGKSAGRLAAMAAAFPIVAVVVYAASVRNILGAKYLIFAQVFLLVGCALLVARIPWKAIRIGLGAALLGWSGYWCVCHAETRESYASFPGVRGAVAYLDERRGAGEPVIVGSPFVHPIVQKYARDKAGIYARNHGDHRDNILGGPPLRDEEYRDLDRVQKQAGGRIWAIDVYEMFRPGTRFEAELTADWTLASQEEFRETYGLACVLAVREYQRSSSKNVHTETHSSVTP